MNSIDQVGGEIRVFLVEQMGLDPGMTFSEPLFSSGLLDSIDMVAILDFIETRWAITFSAFDVGLEDLDSISAIVSQVLSRRG